MKTFTFLFVLFFLTQVAFGQNNIFPTNPLAEEIMLGNYNPADYAASTVINQPDDLKAMINAQVNPDSLKSYLMQMNVFETRNTGSDTSSATNGIGAARRWAFSKFQKISADNENRLLPFFLQFDQNICGMGQHRNTCAILPGTDATDPSIIIIEGHLDSRCEGLCDANCTAHGMDDNGSGSALVLELARVMSQFSFSHSIVFMVTTGEEQGLFGAGAFAFYASQTNIAVKAVLNNDIVGGIICGKTSSPPSCPGENDIDSTQVRLFSASGKPKQLSRFIKLEYQEELQDLVSVPMLLSIMSAEDRSGRGGDHIPFRQNGFAAMRFTSANEHGDAGVGDPNYMDRQHTSRDVLGADTDDDMVIDSFFVDFNYLARNAVINGVAASLAAIGPQTPDFDAFRAGDDSILVEITDPFDFNHYRIFERSGLTDFDTIYTVVGTKTATIPNSSGLSRYSVAAVDANGIESLFTKEKFELSLPTGVNELKPEAAKKVATLLQNRPNPFDEATLISYFVNAPLPHESAFIVISDLQGREVMRIPTALNQGLNEELYRHGYGVTGTFIYSLVVDGAILDSKRMIFAN